MGVPRCSGLVAALSLFAAAAARQQTHNRWTTGTNSWNRKVAVRGGSDAKHDASELGHLMAEEQLAQTSFKELLGDKLLRVSDAATGTTEEVDASQALSGKHVAIYFSSKKVVDKLAEVTLEQGQQVVQPTPRLLDIYKASEAAGRAVEFVYVPVADNEEDFLDQFKGMPWLSIKLDNTTVANLVRKAQIPMLPAVVVLDPRGNVVTTDGYQNMVYFPDDFPWKSKTVKELVGDQLVKADGSTVGAGALDGKVKALYFSADWCAPCKKFTPQLIQTYQALKEQGKELEVVYVSSDKTQEEYDRYLGEMPWLAVPFGDKRRAIIMQLLGITQLPTLLLFDEDWKVITNRGTYSVATDPEGQNFPWHPKPLATLDEAPEALTSKPTLLIFMEGVDKAEQANITAELEPIAVARKKLAEEGEVRSVMFLMATEIDQLSSALRKLCGLDEIQGKFKYMKSKKEIMKPKMVLVDLLRGQLAASDASSISEATVSDFLSKFDEGTLPMQEFKTEDAEEPAAE